jgi:putative endonuclease
MNWKVYILFSEVERRTYVGCSSDTKKRLTAHNEGKVASTCKFAPWRIVFEEAAANYTEARQREKYYKSGAGRRKMKAIFDELGLNK